MDKAGEGVTAKESHLPAYNVNKCLTGLLKISPAGLNKTSRSFNLAIGKFDERKEATYPKKKIRPVHIVIEGAF